MDITQITDVEKNNELMKAFYYSFCTEHPKIEDSLPWGSYHNSYDWLLPVAGYCYTVIKPFTSLYDNLNLALTDI